MTPTPKMKRKQREAFTLIELLTVVLIIIILAGLVISTAGYIQKKAARERATSEIAAMEAALESYKADNGIYPQNTNTDAVLGAKILYQALTGDGNDQLGVSTNPQPSAGKYGDPGKTYMELNSKRMVNTNGYYVIDPWGSQYNYFTGTNRNNPATYDLFSTAGKGTNTNNSMQWIKNW